MSAEQQLTEQDIEAFLERHESKELLRFVVVGSVDDGKSTLIGRLLYEVDGVYDDQLEAVKKASKQDGEIDFSLFTDGLKAEREQGITIDVAYRYFNTERRKFILADTPGHVQYTRNMVTGASTANVGIILVDARLGVLEQSRRHAYIASLLGIPHLLVAVNKMDLRDYSQEVYDTIVADVRAFAKDLRFKDVTFIPVSALKGDNIVAKSEQTTWYDGPTVLEFLETVPIDQDRNDANFRLPVQLVLRPNLNYRGFAGQIASGSVKKGDTLLSLPSGKSSTVTSIDGYEESFDEASAPMSVSIRLADEIDVSRGDMLVHKDDVPHVERTFEADLVWMQEAPLDLDKSYILQHTSQSVRVEVGKVHSRLNMESLEPEEANTLVLNDIGHVEVSARRALYIDPYADNRITGAFVLVDSLTNNTVAAGMIRALGEQQELDEALREIRAGSALKPKTQVSSKERQQRLGQKGATVWLTGLPGSGRWALAYALERRLFDLGHTCHVVDPFRNNLESIISAVRACTNAGLITVAAYPAKTDGQREQVREAVGADDFVEVFVNTDEALCRERRPDADFAGFEVPKAPAVEVALHSTRVEHAVDEVLAELRRRGQFPS